MVFDVVLLNEPIKGFFIVRYLSNGYLCLKLDGFRFK